MLEPHTDTHWQEEKDSVAIVVETEMFGQRIVWTPMENGEPMSVSVEDGHDERDIARALRELACKVERGVSFMTMTFARPEANPELCPVCGQPDNCGDCDHTPA